MKKLTFIAFGDICFSGEIINGVKEGKLPFNFLDGLIHENTIIFGNLECGFIFPQGTTNRNKLSLVADSSLLKYLSCFNILSLANNHSCDHGIASTKHTIQQLKSIGVECVGFGNNIFEARKPVIIDKGDLKVGILAYSCLSTNGENYARQTTPGVSPIVFRYLKDDVQYLKEKVDIIGISLHWGNEQDQFPTAEQVSFAHRIADLGVNFIIGHHTHTVQPFEIYNGIPIYYSLGNSIFSDLICETIDYYGNLNVTKINQSNFNKFGIIPVLTFEKSNDQVRCYNEKVLHIYLDDYGFPQLINDNRIETDFIKINNQFKKFTTRLKENKYKDLQLLNMKYILCEIGYCVRYQDKAINNQYLEINRKRQVIKFLKYLTSFFDNKSSQFFNRKND